MFYGYTDTTTQSLVWVEVSLRVLGSLFQVLIFQVLINLK